MSHADPDWADVKRLLVSWLKGGLDSGKPISPSELHSRVDSAYREACSRVAAQMAYRLPKGMNTAEARADIRKQVIAQLENRFTDNAAA